jgi:hypothetical protein
MRLLLLPILALVLTGCMITDREAVYYTRSDVDAINSGIQCRQLARTLVQIARCEVRR